MAKPRRIGPPPPKSTPAELQSSLGEPRPLAPDLLKQASLRLGIMSLVGAALWIIGPTLGHIAYRPTPSGGEYYWLPFTAPIDIIAGVSAAISLGLFFYTRRSRRDPAFILDLGLAYMVVMALAIGLMFHVGMMVQAERFRGQLSIRPELSWIGAIVLMFVAIVPSTPRKALLAGLAAVAMNPIAMWIAHAQGKWDFGPPINALLMHYPDFLLVGVAVVISRVVTQLGRQVTKAREMGSYELGELIGRGGMGEVYRATHRMLARPAAIKLIRPEMLGGDGESEEVAVKRFYREAETAASLRSPHSVEIYDFGVTEDETLYLVMELLEGLDLESLVREYGPMPANRVIHILRQVCESLEEAHSRGLVHRDIKPANIHVGELALRRDFTKVLDFGLAKPVRGPDAQRSLATAAGLAVGTPAYMPPEMALGEPVDARSDIYALGCVAYYLLTGKLVFETENALQSIAKHMQAQPVPPSQRTELVVPAALDQVVLKCLAKEPKDRPQSAAELTRSLASIDVEPWNDEQAREWWSSTDESVHRSSGSALNGTLASGSTSRRAAVGAWSHDEQASSESSVR